MFKEFFDSINIFSTPKKKREYKPIKNWEDVDTWKSEPVIVTPAMTAAEAKLKSSVAYEEKLKNFKNHFAIQQINDLIKRRTDEGYSHAEIYWPTHAFSKQDGNMIERYLEKELGYDVVYFTHAFGERLAAHTTNAFVIKW